MDIYSFISSKAIRDRYMKTGRDFSPPECAWIIYHSGSSLEKKLSAYKELIASTEDSVTVYKDKKYSLHHVLSKYIEAKNILIDEFIYAEEAGLYCFEFMKYGDTDACSYKNYYSCLNAAKTFAEKHGYRYNEFFIFKNTAAETGIVRTMYMTYTESCDCGNVEVINEDFEYEKIIAGLPFVIDAPFEPGDIVCNPHGYLSVTGPDTSMPCIFINSSGPIAQICCRDFEDVAVENEFVWFLDYYPNPSVDISDLKAKAEEYFSQYH